MMDQHLNPYSVKGKKYRVDSQLQKWFGLDFAICYFFNVFGPGQISDGQYATVIGIFERQYREGKPLSVVTPGTQTRAFTHIDDIVKGILMVGEKGDGDGYFLGTEENISILDIVDCFSSEYVFIPERKGERLASVMHESRARTELNWTTERDLRSYISSIVKDCTGAR